MDIYKKYCDYCGEQQIAKNRIMQNMSKLTIEKKQGIFKFEICGKCSEEIINKVENNKEKIERCENMKWMEEEDGQYKKDE